MVSRDGATVGHVSARRAGSRISLSTEGIEAAFFLLVGAQLATAADDELVVSPTPQGILIHSKRTLGDHIGVTRGTLAQVDGLTSERSITPPKCSRPATSVGDPFNSTSRFTLCDDLIRVGVCVR